MDFGDIIIQGANDLGVGVSDDQAESLIKYADELLRWNRKVNLTAITDPAEVAAKHFLDSLALLRMLPEGPFRAADVGAGAGFPGLVLKVARPDMDLTLIEPARKKATFLRHIVRTLGLAGATVADRRVEDLWDGLRGRFDVIFSRAFREFPTLAGLAGPILAPGGVFVLSMGPSWDGAMPEGWSIGRLEKITIPVSGTSRSLVAAGRAQ